MRDVIYSMSMSLDGFTAAPGGDIGWSMPDEELHRFHNDRVRALGVHLLGRRLYETMTYWETVDDDPSAEAVELEFAGIWQRLPKIVFSTTLERVEGRTRLVRDGLADEIARLRAQPDEGDIAIGGPGLAADAIRLGLVDEFGVFVHPVVLGAGTPFFPPGGERIELELVETRTFPSRVVYLRYRRA